MSSRRAILAAASTGVQVGAALVATRLVIGETGPATLALLRYAIGFVCLAPALPAVGGMRFARRDLLPIALLGIGQFGILIALLNYGLKFIPAARAALIFACFPLITMLLAAAVGRERLTWARSVGVLLTIAGVGFALGEKSLARGADAAWHGEAAVFASALVGALCSLLYRPYLRRYPTVAVSAFAMLASVAFLALLAANEGLYQAMPHFSARGWAAVLFIGVSSGVGYFLWLYALGHAPATQVTVFLALSPVTAALLGAWLLGEAPSVNALIGLAGVVLGLVLALWPHKDVAD
jgi:drug/metabolite transporter (DMT)-like permease